MRKTNTKLLTIIAICIAIDCLDASTAVSTKAPLSLDRIGSLLVCMLLEWKYGVVTAFLSSVTNQILFNPFALPFAPTGMPMVSMVRILYEKRYFKKLHTTLAPLLAVLPGAILGTTIQGYIFDGVTSSGSDAIVRFMINKGVNPAAASFINRYFMESVDRLISFTVVMTAVKRIKIELIC